MTRPVVIVLADDLIWASRLEEAVRRAGAEPVRLGRAGELEVVLEAMDLVEPSGVPGVDPEVPGTASSPGRVGGAVVDLGGRRYDGVAMVGRIRAAAVPVIAVAQHDDQPTRRAALDAGATRVFSYAKFFTDGPRLVAGWLSTGSGT